MAIPLTDTFGFTPNKPNIDKRYLASNGQPYASVAAAETALASRLVETCIGLTVLVKESGWTEAKEYWVQPLDTTPVTYGFVEKGAGTTDYTQLSNLPSINGTTLTGNVSLATPEQLAAKQDTLVSGKNIRTINGESILGSGNITIQGGGSGSGGTTDYTDLTNKPSINGVVLSGNKTTSQLGINIPTKTSDLTNDSGFLTSETEPAFNSSVAKNITNADITNWNSKQAQLQSGVNIMTINNNSILGSGNLDIQTGGTPESITVTDTTYTIASLVGNKIYTFTNPLTSLTITAYGDTSLETVLYFTTGTNFNFSVPNDSKYIIEVPVFNEGINYVVSIQNKTIVMGEIVEQTVSLNSIDNNNE